MYKKDGSASKMCQGQELIFHRNLCRTSVLDQNRVIKAMIDGTVWEGKFNSDYAWHQSRSEHTELLIQTKANGSLHTTHNINDENDV